MDAEIFEGRFGYGYIINLGYPWDELPSERKREFGTFLRAHKVMHVARSTWYVHTRMSFQELKTSLTTLLREGESIFIIPIPEGGLTAHSLQMPKDISDPKLLDCLERYRKMTPEDRIDGRLDDPTDEDKHT